MQLPSQKKVLREDVKGAPSWVNPLLDTLNSFMETVYQAMNHNITFSENIAGQVKELTYKTNALYPSGMDDTKFMSTLKTKATGLMLLQVVENVTYAPPPGPVYIPWVESNGSIVIKTITGLQASKTYTVRILVT